MTNKLSLGVVINWNLCYDVSSGQKLVKHKNFLENDGEIISLKTNNSIIL